MEKTSPEATKELLRKCDSFHREGKFREALELASSKEGQNAQTEMLPYVLEMQVRNMIELLMFTSALKLIDEVLKYIPNLRDFLYRKVECQLALGKTEEAIAGLESLLKKIEEDQKSQGDQPKEDEWADRVIGLLSFVRSRVGKQKDLIKTRIYFKEGDGEKVSLQEFLKKQKTAYAFTQNDAKVIVIPTAKCTGTEDKVHFEVKPKQLKMNYPSENGALFSLDIDLFDFVEVKECNFQLMGDGGLLVTLVKTNKNKHWETLEELLAEKHKGANKAGLSHTEKNWQQICKRSK